jgi:undecaprenyl diphosphate synthase
MAKEQEFVLRKPCDHIAFIMDGNGRWAKKRLLPRHLGHKAGCERIVEITRACQDLGVKVMTLYAFSTENWNRPQDEIDHLFDYLDEFFKNNIDEFMQRGTRIHVMGDVSRLPEHSQITLKESIERTKNNDRFVFNICLNYGGRQDIVHACKNIVKLVQEGKLKEEDINEETFKQNLYSEDLPDVDLMIRTSGEIRVSNYCLYQLSYAEMIFTKTYWPDFTKKELIKCLQEYESRDRRFGSIK